jgi:hypothetical protein
MHDSSAAQQSTQVCFALTKSEALLFAPLTPHAAGLYRGGVDSSQIKPHQAAQLRQTVRRPLVFMGRMRRRMELLGFPPDDPLYLSICQAHNALQEVHVRAHYCACTTGVGKPAPADPLSPPSMNV